MKILRALLALGLLVALAAGIYLMRARPPPPGTAAQSWTPVTRQRLSHGRFENVLVYQPRAAARAFVLLLSGAGSAAASADLAARIAAQGALVAVLDVPQFNASLGTDGAQCVYPDGDLENLSHFVQAYFHVPGYLSPLLVGEAAGATLAYAVLAQAPVNTFAGAISLGFCPDYALAKPLCKGSGIESAPRGKGIVLLPAKQTGLAWKVLQAADQPACDADTVERFVVQVPGAQYSPVAADGVEAVVAAVNEFMARHALPALAEIPADLAGLPLVNVPAAPGTPQSDTFAIILSGDGGWAGLDKDVAGALAAAGIPVVGLDSLRYFWSARTPQSLAADLDRMTRHYLTALGKQKVLLIGYSQGADVLPFAINRLRAETRAHVALTAVMGMSKHALFEFHVSSWISDDDSGPATLPEVDRISGMPLLCIYGSEEDDTLCPKLDPGKATIVKLKGGHHFDGDYAGLARLILASAQRGKRD